MKDQCFTSPCPLEMVYRMKEAEPIVYIIDDDPLIRGENAETLVKYRQNSCRTAMHKRIWRPCKKSPRSGNRGDYVVKGGWATGYNLARACAEKLLQAKTAPQ